MVRLGLAVSTYRSATETYDVLQVILNGDVQAGLVARLQSGGVRFDISRVDGTNGVDYVFPGLKV